MTLNANGVECKVADPCGRCMAGYPHRARVMAYDPAAGDYVKLEPPICLARWDDRNDGHIGDDICGAPADRRVAGVEVCEHHYQMLTRWGFWEVPADDNEEDRQALIASQRNLLKEVRKQERERERLRQEEQERARAAWSVVYFIRRTADGAVKIGTSRGLEQRMKALRTQHGELQLLLTLAGDRALEAEMHARFDLYRTPRTEWFAPTRVLMKWICDQRDDRRYRGSQFDEVLHISDLRKLARKAPYESVLRWHEGRVVWPQPEAA